MEINKAAWNNMPAQKAAQGPLYRRHLVGYHILMIFISENAFKKKEPWAYKAMWVGLLSWFLIDSGISVYYGAIHNLVLINLVALILIGLPLIMTRKKFKDDRIAA